MIPAVHSSSSRQPTMSYRELHPFVLHSTPCATFAPLQQLLRFGLFTALRLLLTPTTTNSQSLPSQAHYSPFRFIFVLIPSALCIPFGCCVWLACDTHSASCLSWFLCFPRAFPPALPLLKHLAQLNTKTHARHSCKHSCTPPSFFGLKCTAPSSYSLRLALSVCKPLRSLHPLLLC